MTSIVHAEVEASSFGLPDARRKVAVVNRALGSANPKYDNEVASTADRYGIPPQFLKSQALQESGFYKKNFHYEPMTRDLTHMTGDRLRNPPDLSTRWLETEPLRSYAISGSWLIAPTPVTDTVMFPNPSNPEEIGPTFELGVPVMRGYDRPDPKPATEDAEGNLVYAPGMVEPRVFATITAEGAEDVDLRLVSNYPIWRRRTSWAESPPGWIEPAHDLEDTDFSVDFLTGTVTIGRQLMVGESLTVRFDPVDDRNSETFSFGGSFTFDLNDKDLVREEIELQYAPGETLFDWLRNNLRGSGRRPYANWLTNNLSEKRLEFTVQAGTNRPDEPIDPRFQRMTAQPFASSSYGVLQLTLTSWLDTRFGGELTEVIDPASENIAEVLTNVDKGLALGAILHQSEYEQRLAAGDVCNPCTTDEWLSLWDGIIRNYSLGARGYIGTPYTDIVIRGVNEYEPR